jgi:hypothetical protein
MLNFNRIYLYIGIFTLLGGGFGAWYYKNVYYPKQENIKKAKRIKELEENISMSHMNREIEISNTMIKYEHNQNSKKMKDIADENFTNIYDFNDSDFLNGMFIFNPERKD